MSRRPYVRRMRRNWWLGRRRYLTYMVLELTSLFVGFYCAWLAIGLVCLARGPAAWESFLSLASSPGGVVFQVVCLAFAAYHTITWFALTPKAMPLMARGRTVSPWPMVSAHYAVWAVISVTVVIVAVV